MQGNQVHHLFLRLALPQKAFQSQPVNRAKTPYPGMDRFA
jgi:hypothetical protein